MSQVEAAKAHAQRRLHALAGFARKLKVTFRDIEVGIDFDPEPGLADNGDLEHDLQALFEQGGLAAKSAGTALAIFIDELQYVEESQLAALITAMHRTGQRRLPVVLVGAGLPQLRGRRFTDHGGRRGHRIGDGGRGAGRELFPVCASTG